MSTPPPRFARQSAKKYAALDGIRGYAAILVTLTHFVLAYTAGFRGLSLDRFNYASLPNSGDRIFLWLAMNMQSLYILLTISGFMVCRMVLRQTYPGYFRFLVGRSLRIYPPFIFSLLFALAIAQLFAWPMRLDAANVLYNIFMLNGIFELQGQPFNFPSWTLFYEVMYCLLAPGIVAIVRGTWRVRIQQVFGIWLMLALCLVLIHFSGWAFFTPFAIGSMLAQLDDRQLIAAAAKIPTTVVIGVYVFVSALPNSWAPLPSFDGHGIHFTGQYIAFIILACVMSCLLVTKAVFSAGLLQNIFSFRPLEYLGKISYSFYLLHAPLIGVTFAVFAGVISRHLTSGSILHFVSLISVFWLMTLVAATIGYYLVEMLYFRSSLSSRSGKRVRVARDVDSAAIETRPSDSRSAAS
jgi:exopolysaccharide production protein ExoZ